MYTRESTQVVRVHIPATAFEHKPPEHPLAGRVENELEKFKEAAWWWTKQQVQSPQGVSYIYTAFNDELGYTTHLGLVQAVLATGASCVLVEDGQSGMFWMAGDSTPQPTGLLTGHHTAYNRRYN